MEPVMGGFLGAVAAGAVVMVYQAVARIPVGQNFWAEVVVALIGFGIGYFVVRERWNEHARVYQEELEKRRERSNA
jgi:hypothetical protein